MRHQPLLAKISFAAFFLGTVIALTACIGTRLHHWDLAFGTKLLTPGIGFGVLGLVCGIGWIWRALAMNNSLGRLWGAIGLIGSTILVGIPANYLWHVYTLPPIHDISTDIGNAPQFHTLLKWRKGAPNSARYDGPVVITYDGEKMTTAVAQKDAYPDIKTLPAMDNRTRQKQFVAKYFWRALNAVHAEGWQVASFDEKKGRIEATSASFWFGTISDIVIRVRPAGTVGVLVDIRAKSRRGVSDAGRNAELIRAFISREKNG